MFHDPFNLLIVSAFTVVGGFMLFFAYTMARTAIRLGPKPKGLGLKDATWRATGLSMSGMAALAGIICLGAAILFRVQGLN